MTLLEKFKQFVLVIKYSNLLKQYTSMLEDVVEYFEKCERHKWHDLETNPDDLPDNPDEEQICLVKHICMKQDIYGEDFEYYVYSTATYDGNRFNYGTGFDETDHKVHEVVAWCEIDQYENK